MTQQSQLRFYFRTSTQGSYYHNWCQHEGIWSWWPAGVELHQWAISPSFSTELGDEQGSCGWGQCHLQRDSSQWQEALCDQDWSQNQADQRSLPLGKTEGIPNWNFSKILQNFCQVACVAQIKAVFWSKGVENIFVENPETHFQVLESMEGYWIGNFNFYDKNIFSEWLLTKTDFSGNSAEKILVTKNANLLFMLFIVVNYILKQL